MVIIFCPHEAPSIVMPKLTDVGGGSIVCVWFCDLSPWPPPPFPKNPRTTTNPLPLSPLPRGRVRAAFQDPNWTTIIRLTHETVVLLSTDIETVDSPTRMKPKTFRSPPPSQVHRFSGLYPPGSTAIISPPPSKGRRVDQLSQIHPTGRSQPGSSQIDKPRYVATSQKAVHLVE